MLSNADRSLCFSRVVRYVVFRLTKVLNFRHILRKGIICKKIKVLLPLLFPLYYMKLFGGVNGFG